jgi:hypothetical protein
MPIAFSRLVNQSVSAGPPASLDSCPSQPSA